MDREGGVGAVVSRQVTNSMIASDEKEDGVKDACEVTGDG